MWPFSPPRESIDDKIKRMQHAWDNAHQGPPTRADQIYWQHDRQAAGNGAVFRANDNDIAAGVGGTGAETLRHLLHYCAELEARIERLERT